MARERDGVDVVLREPADGILAVGDERVDAEEDGGFLVEGGELKLPGIPELILADGVEPVGDGLTDGARLLRELLLAGEDFRRREAVVNAPFGKIVTHQDPLRADERLGLLGIDEEAEGAPPAGGLENCLGDEITVAFSPAGVLLEGGRELMIEDSVVDEDGFGKLQSGGAEVAVEFHKK